MTLPPVPYELTIADLRAQIEEQRIREQAWREVGERLRIEIESYRRRISGLKRQVRRAP